MTVNVDPKDSFIIPKFWGGIVSALFTVLIALIGYIYVTSTKAQTAQYIELKAQSLEVQQDIYNLRINQFSLQDVMQNLHPDQKVGEMMYDSQLKYYMNTTRSPKKDK